MVLFYHYYLNSLRVLFKFYNPSEVQITKTLICTKKIPGGFWQ